jgi:hypothetical protein
MVQEYVLGDLCRYPFLKCAIIVVNGEIDRNDCPEIEVPAQADQKFVHYRATGLLFKQEYRFVVKGVTNGGQGDPNSVDASTVPQAVPANGMVSEGVVALERTVVHALPLLRCDLPRRGKVRFVKAS